MVQTFQPFVAHPAYFIILTRPTNPSFLQQAASSPTTPPAPADPKTNTAAAAAAAAASAAQAALAAAAHTGQVRGFGPGFARCWVRLA